MVATKMLNIKNKVVVCIYCDTCYKLYNYNYKPYPYRIGVNTPPKDCYSCCNTLINKY